MAGPWEKYQQVEAGPWTNYATQPEPMAGSPPNPRRYTNPNRGKSNAELAGLGALKFLNNASLGRRQLMTGLAGLVGLEGSEEEANMLEGIADARKLDPVMKTTAGQVGYTGAALVPAVAASFVPGANTVVGQGLIGAGMGLLQPTGTGDSRLENTALGAGTGMAGQGVANGIGRIAQPIKNVLTGAEDDAVRLLRDQGVNLRPGQMTGSRAAKGAERFLADNPVTGPTMERASQKQAQEFTRAALRTIGVNADNASPQVLQAARTQITGVLDNIGKRYAPDINAIAPDLAAVRGEADLLALYGSPILKLVDDIERTAQAGKLTGEVVAKYRTTLGRLSRDPYVGGLARDLDEVLSNGLHQAMQGTDDFARYAQARTQYRNLKSIESAVQNVADAQIPAGTLASRQATSRFTKDSFKYGTGDQELARLARAGSTVLDRTPNSGTAMRAGAQLLPAGVAGLVGYAQERDPVKAAQYAAFGLLAPRMAASMFTNPAVANYLGQGIGGFTGGLLSSANRIPLGSLAAAGLLSAQ